MCFMTEQFIKLKILWKESQKESKCQNVSSWRFLFFFRHINPEFFPYYYFIEFAVLLQFPFFILRAIYSSSVSFSLF